jgi:rubrerythrin
MAVRFSADEVLQMAQMIEANAARFYESAADFLRDERCRKLVIDLSRWEKTHERTFADMRTALLAAEKESPVFDPNDEASLYLQALADTKVVRPREDPRDRLGASPEPRQVLSVAMDLERESIVFYVGLKDLVPPALGKPRVDAILNEERRHVTILSQELAQLG